MSYIRPINNESLKLKVQVNSYYTGIGVMFKYSHLVWSLAEIQKMPFSSEKYVLLQQGMVGLIGNQFQQQTSEGSRQCGFFHQSSGSKPTLMSATLASSWQFRLVVS